MNSGTKDQSYSPAVVPLCHTLRTAANPATVSQTCQLARLALTHFHGGGRRWDGPGPPLQAREGSGSRVATKITLFCPRRGNWRTDFRNKPTFVPAPVSFKCCRNESENPPNLSSLSKICLLSQTCKLLLSNKPQLLEKSGNPGAKAQGPPPKMVTGANSGSNDNSVHHVANWTDENNEGKDTNHLWGHRDDILTPGLPASTKLIRTQTCLEDCL